MRVVINSNPLKLPDTKPTLGLFPECAEDRQKLIELIDNYDVWFGKSPSTGEALHVEIPLERKIDD